MGFDLNIVSLMYAKQIKGGTKKIEDVPLNLQSLTLEKLKEL